MTSSALAKENHPHAGRFATTRWSLIQAASDDEESAAKEALEHLCKLYWFPIYAHFRRKGQTPEQAADTTQAFFAHILETDAIGRAAPERGRFRSYLLTAADHFSINEFEKQSAQKRGGGRRIVSIDLRNAEGRLCHEPLDDDTPALAFERNWATALLDRVFEDLKAEYEQSDRRELFRNLYLFLGSSRTVSLTYAEVAETLRMSESAVKGAVHRMRKRFGERLRQTIQDTVESDQDIDEEIQRLFQATSRGTRSRV